MLSEELRGLAAKLKPLDIRRYAEHSAWEAISSGVRGRLWVFRHREHTLRQLQIPMDADDTQWLDALDTIIQRIAELESRSPMVVIEDLLAGDADVLRFRVVVPGTRGGQLRLANDIALRDGVRRALLASACSVVAPVAFHPRMSRAEAEDLLDTCRAGQTEVGSYVMKVICPMDVEGGQPALTDDPFARRVTKFFMKSVAELVQVVESTDRNIADFVGAQRQTPTVSANLCEALLKMQADESEGGIDISTSWSAVRDRPVSVPSRVSVKAEYFPVIEQISRELRPRSQGTNVDSLIGTVEVLGGDVGDDGRRAGDVTLALLLPDSGEQIKVRASLGTAHYALATEAHGRGKAYVRIRGVLHRGTKMGRIEHVEAFSILDDGSAPERV